MFLALLPVRAMDLVLLLVVTRILVSDDSLFEVAPRI
jgi:hypothetical protein